MARKPTSKPKPSKAAPVPTPKAVHVPPLAPVVVPPPAARPPDSPKKVNLPAMLKQWLAVLASAAGAAALANAKFINPVVTIFAIIAVGMGVLFLVVVAKAAYVASTQNNKHVRNLAIAALIFGCIVVAVVVVLALPPLSKTVNKWIEYWSPPEPLLPDPPKPGPHPDLDNNKPILLVKDNPERIRVTQGVPRTIYINQYVNDKDIGDRLLVDAMQLEHNTTQPVKCQDEQESVAGVFGCLTPSEDRTTVTYLTKDLSETMDSGRDIFAIEVIDSRQGKPRGGRVILHLAFDIAGNDNHSPEVPKPDSKGLEIKWLYKPGKGLSTTIDLGMFVRDEDVNDRLRITSAQVMLVPKQATSAPATPETPDPDPTTLGTVNFAEGSMELVFTPTAKTPEFVDIIYHVTDDRPGPMPVSKDSKAMPTMTDVPGKIRVRVMKEELDLKLVAADSKLVPLKQIEPHRDIYFKVIADPDEQSKYDVTTDIPPEDGSRQSTGPFYGIVGLDTTRPWVLVYRPDPASSRNDEFRFSVFDKFSGKRVGGNLVKIDYKKSE